MSETQLKPSGYSLSSWNYGSFHHCNPVFLPNEYLKRDSNQEPSRERAQSANLNRFGKRVLADEEKIVSNEQLKLINDYHIIKHGKPYIRSHSGNKPVTRASQSGEMPNSDNQSDLLEHNNSQFNKSTLSQKKQIKYKLSYDEWKKLKSKQEEIQRKIKMIKDHEDSQLEMYNKRINKEYKSVVNDVFNDWMQKKKLQKQAQTEKKKNNEEKKLIEKQDKERLSNENLERWFMRQAVVMEEDYRKKKAKKQREKEMKERKQNEENIKKEQAQEAYRLWCRNKEEELYKIKQEKNQNQDKKKPKQYHTTGKLTLGPYTKGKELREIQKKYANDHQYFSTDFQKSGDGNEKIEDSLQELSSIKKDTPNRSVNENDYD